ncbi:MAG: ABC transporter substrate-binding protein [Pseudomonadota bacterium]
MTVQNIAKTFGAACLAVALGCGPSLADEPILVGLDADFSGPLREVSIAVQQGAEAAVHQINATGGVQGRPIQLIVTDHRSNPRRARDNFDDGHAAGIVAMVSGAQSTGALSQLEAAQAAGIPLISAFPGSTKITQNGMEPNPAFRVSARDSETNAFLVRTALEEGRGRIALLIENSRWGASNDAGAHRAVDASDRGEIVATGWFALGGEDFETALNEVLAARPDTILLFGKPPQGVGLLEALAGQPADARPKALMHWGVAQGEAFGQAAAGIEGVDYGVFQTFSFASPHDAQQAAGLLGVTCRLHEICDADDARTPSPMAQGYDTVQLIALGMREVEGGSAPTLFDALQALPDHRGLIRSYGPAFTPDRREALDQQDFLLVRYAKGGVPVPVNQLNKAAR